MNDKIAENIDMAAVADFCQRWHISEMALFGSVLRDDFAEDSDSEKNPLDIQRLWGDQGAVGG